jgi:hypothetical protein
VLREVKNGRWTCRLTVFGWHYDFFAGKKAFGTGWRTRQWRILQTAQAAKPTVFLQGKGRRYLVVRVRVLLAGREPGRG